MKYTEENLWIKQRGSKVEIGITNYIRDNLGEVIMVDMPEAGEDIEKGETIFTVEFNDNVIDFKCPLHVKVIKFNEDLEEDTGLINEDSESVYIIKCETLDADELDELLSLKEYKEICN